MNVIIFGAALRHLRGSVPKARALRSCARGLPGKRSFRVAGTASVEALFSLAVAMGFSLRKATNQFCYFLWRGHEKSI